MTQSQTQYSLILASGSKARLNMLRSAGVSVEQDIARIDEQTLKSALLNEGHPPRDIADALAEAKAKRVSLRHPGCLVLGADQILVCDGQIFDKPADMSSAQEHLSLLSGKTHELLSAAVMMRDGQVTFRHIGQSKMSVRKLTEKFIVQYLDLEGDVLLDCVGAYRLESAGAQIFSRVDGDYFTVLGLPLLEILEHLRNQGYLQQ